MAQGEAVFKLADGVLESLAGRLVLRAGVMSVAVLDAAKLVGKYEVFEALNEQFRCWRTRSSGLSTRTPTTTPPRGRIPRESAARPHSHHWQVMAKVLADEHEAGTISVGGADIMMAMTSVGDGDFPMHLELDDAGTPTAIVVVIDTEA